ncbi:MAG TPA: DNA-binding protein [Burkholderiaceae bacterium]|jgi:hypothetical protein
MTLQNLLKIGRLKEHQPTPAELQRLLAAAERNLADARVVQVSDETRFDAAYRAVMQCALAAMMANGYRPSTSEPGHHQTLIQSLPLTLGLANDVWVVLDALRRKRNASDYTGDVVQPGMVGEATAQADSLLKALRAWLKVQHPDLLK